MYITKKSIGSRSQLIMSYTNENAKFKGLLVNLNYAHLGRSIYIYMFQYRYTNIHVKAIIFILLLH